jgi:hypothetical protein
MIQRFVEVPAQQTGILGLVELAGADCWSRNRMGRNKAADRCPDGAVVGGDPAVIAIQKGVDRLPGVVDAAGEVRGCPCRSGPGNPATPGKICFLSALVGWRTLWITGP